MAAIDKTQDPESQRETGPTMWQKHRRAQLEWMRAIQAVHFDYQRQIAEANVVYSTSLHKVTDESWNRRLTALDAAVRSPDTVGWLTVEMTRDHSRAVNETNRVAQEAYGRAWYQLQDGLQAAYAKYVAAAGDYLHPSGAASMAMGVMAGDEGPTLPEQPFNPATQFWGALGRM